MPIPLVQDSRRARRLRRLCVCAAVAAALGWAPARAADRQPEPPPAAASSAIPHEDFEVGLEHLGEWITLPALGAAWRPAGVEPGWVPYRHGRWAWTRAGWFWVTSEPWGWATYHYGRWLFHDSYGWVWLPGSEWSPAWVSWRTSGEVVGWAPLPPRNAQSYWASWTFVPAAAFTQQPVERHAIPAPRVPALLVRTQGRAPPRPPPESGIAPQPSSGGSQASAASPRAPGGAGHQRG